MKVKKEALVLGALIVALMLYLVFQSKDHNTFELPNLEAIAATDIIKIVLDSSDGKIEIFQKKGDWVINAESHPGDSGRIDPIVDIIAKLTLTTLISDSKEYERYELDPSHRVRIQAWDDDKVVREFDVGKAGPGHRHTFVKIAGDHRVYHARNSFRSKFEGSFDTFRDRSVLSFEADQVKQVSIVKGDQQAVYSRIMDSEETGKESTGADTDTPATPPDVWQDQAGKIVNTKMLTRLIKGMSALKCKSYIYDIQKSDLGQPVATVTFVDTETHHLEIFASRDDDQSQFPATSSYTNYLFFLPDWSAFQILNAISDIEADKLKKQSES